MRYIIVIFLAVAIASYSRADTYRLGAGATGGERRCASPRTKTRLTDFVAKGPRVTVGHGQMTVTIDDAPWGADRLVVGSKGVVHTGFWHAKPDPDGAAILMEIVVDTYGEATSPSGDEHQPEAIIRIAKTFDGATCVEEWHGKASAVR